MLTIKNYSLEYIKGKKVSVIGIGISNTPLIYMLKEFGAFVTAHDKKTIDELGKTAKTALRWFGIAFICFVIRIVFDGTAHVWLYAILFSVYGVVVFGLAIATQFLRKKRIEKINKKLAEIYG